MIENHNYSLDNKIENKPYYNFKFLNNFNLIKNWNLDKVNIEHKTNIVKKIEVYNYINRNDVSKLIKYLNTKKFKYFINKSSFPRLFNILLSKNNNFTTGQGEIIKKENIKFFRRYYFVDYVNILNHRGRPILIKIYRNISENKTFSKIEFTYLYYKKDYNLYFLDWINSLKGINEIIKKINNRFDFIGYGEDFSKKISFTLFLNKILGNKTKSNKIYRNKIFKMFTGKID